MPRKKTSPSSPPPAEPTPEPTPAANSAGDKKPRPSRTPKAAAASAAGRAKPTIGKAQTAVLTVEAPATEVPVQPSAVKPSAVKAARSRGGKTSPAAPEPPPISNPTPTVAAEPSKPSARRNRTGKATHSKPIGLSQSEGAGAEASLVAETHAEVVEPPPVAPLKPAQTKSEKKRGSDRQAPKAKPAAVAHGVTDSAFFDLPIPSWRPRQRPATASTAAEEEESPEYDPFASEESAPALEPKSEGARRRRRKRGRGEPATEEAPIAPVKAPEPPVRAVAPARTKPPEAPPVVEEHEVAFRRDRPPVKAPEKAAIQIPDDAPQIVVRAGVPTLVRNHRVYPPIMFFGSPADERRAKTVLEEVAMAAEAGIHLHSYLIDFDVDLEKVDQAAKFAAYMLSRSVQVDPESQVIFRMVLQAPRNWPDRYPNAVFKHADGSVGEPSVCDDDFWGVAKNCLERFVKQVRLLDLSKHILGLHLERGEWFFAEGAGYDDSRAANAKFRDWARTRYGDDEVTLRASWFDGSVRFDTIRVPDYRPEGDEGERFIRSSRRQRRYVDYHLFLSDATVQRIADLAYVAKEASEGYFLIGASYGYTFEWSHPSSGHLSLGKLLRTPEIDFIAGPPSYRTRQPGGSAPFPGPIDSFALNGKLYISEEDFKTSLSEGHEPDDFNPQLKTPQALESVHWRGAGAALAHAGGVAWMDLWGNGWLRTHSVWERAKKVREAMVDRLAAPLDDPEVAVFIDERALAYLVDSHAFKLLVQNVRESVLRAGVSAAFYLLSDLAHREKFPESKLYLFVNAWDVRPELRSAIKSRLQRDNKVLFWLYSAGLFDAGRESLERAREVTGIALKPQPFNSRSGTTILNRRHPLSEAFPDRTLVGGSKMEPSYFAIPEGATVLGEYSQTGLPSFVVKEFREGPADTHWTSVFLGEPQVNPALIRGLAQMAGAHVWNFHEDVVHVRHPFCTVHCQGTGPRTITLPGKFSAYNLLTDEWSAVDAPNLRFSALDGMTYCYLVGPRAELEHQLHADPRTVLHIESLPPREANIRVDISSFDVPIMKLDEWMGGDDSDENADEWFLRPHQIDEEPPSQAEESPERVGRRRRRRRSGRGGQEEPGGHTREEFSVSSGEGAGAGGFDDIGMNVLFRKRE